jgi:hypothetical protein
MHSPSPVAQPIPDRISSDLYSFRARQLIFLTWKNQPVWAQPNNKMNYIYAENWWVVWPEPELPYRADRWAWAEILDPKKPGFLQALSGSYYQKKRQAHNWIFKYDLFAVQLIKEIFFSSTAYIKTSNSLVDFLIFSKVNYAAPSNVIYFKGYQKLKTGIHAVVDHWTRNMQQWIKYIV